MGRASPVCRHEVVDGVVADQLWKYAQAKLRDAQGRKWDNDLPHDVRRYNQGIADTLRVMLILMRDDPEFAAKHQQEWEEFSGSAARADPDYLCPIDGYVMNFVLQCMDYRRYKCTHPDDHGVWDFDWMQHNREER